MHWRSVLLRDERRRGHVLSETDVFSGKMIAAMAFRIARRKTVRHSVQPASGLDRKDPLWRIWRHWAQACHSASGRTEWTAKICACVLKSGMERRALVWGRTGQEWHRTQQVKRGRVSPLPYVRHRLLRPSTRLPWQMDSQGCCYARAQSRCGPSSLCGWVCGQLACMHRFGGHPCSVK